MKRQPITKDNYEEFFLLYVDNELTDAEKAEVDSFIEKNPGLKMELQMFLDTRLDMEDVKMEGLENLFRYEEEGLVNKDNYEEYQVLLVDNELGQKEEIALEKYHETHPEAAANFAWLKKTKLPDEHIVFPDKRSLYRTEKKPATLISIRWVRYAAAAVLVMAGLLWINSDKEETAPAIEQPVAQVETPVKDNKDANNTDTLKSETENKEANGTNVEEQTNTKALAAAESPVISATPATREQSQAKRTKAEPGNEALASADQQQIAAVDKNETRIRTEDLLLQQTTESATAPAPYVQPAVAKNVKNNYATDALNGAMYNEEIEPVQEESKQRKGLRGIVRKANRIYNKVTNPDLDKPLVKVANLEIGLQR